MNERRTALRVGIFVVLGIAVLTFAVLVLGAKGGLFQSKSTLYVDLSNINGLVVGAPVRLAGLDIGRVSKIHFSEDLNRREARVELSVQERYLPRVRGDSRAFIDSKGLLGDKLINITIGSPDQAQLREGDVIPARDGVSMEELAAKVNQAVTSITRVTDQAGTVLEGLAQPETRADMQRVLHSVAGILEGVEHSDGVAHRLIYDRGYADEVDGILRETQGGLAALRGALEHVRAVTAEVEGGKGTAHELIYGQRGAAALTDIQQASAELAQLVRAVRTEPGLLHTLIYDERSGDMLAQWSDFSERVNRLSQQVEQGHGTLGGLLVDPSIYDDLKSLLGNIERSVLFKALIRYTIKEGDIKRPALMPAPAAADSGGTR
ncbi:MAG: MlaD family protein [Polyangiales bacterium]